MKTLMVLTILAMMTLPAVGGNMIVNGDFETGDLHGWVEAGPDTVPRYETHGAGDGPLGPLPTPAQVFNSAAPLYILEQYDEPEGVRHVRAIGLASDIAPKSGYSCGWTRTGLDKTNYPWIRQILRVAPGRYLVNASWDVICWAGAGKADRQALAGILFVHVDDQVNWYTLKENALRRTVWNTESNGKWVHKEVKDHPIETATGNIEVRLMILHGNEDPIVPPDFEYVAFDNVVFDLTPAPLRQYGADVK